MTIAEALSARLTELMEEKHLTAYRLSMLTGVNQTTIGDIKHKRNVAVNVRVLFELCQGLGIEIVEFFNSPLFATENIIDYFSGVCMVLHTPVFIPFRLLTVNVKVDIIEVSKTDGASVIEKVRAITNANEETRLDEQNQTLY